MADRLKGKVARQFVDQATLEKKIRKIYCDANAYADEVGGVKYGMNIPLGPPKVGW